MVQELTPPPYIYTPAKSAGMPLIFAVPHSGRHYPQDFKNRSVLELTDLRRSEDAFVDQLFEDAPNSHAALLVATHARAYLDLNRASNELDPSMFTPKLDESELNISYRVQAGLGAIPQYVAENMPIYDRPLPARDAIKRIDSVHKPYHEKLRAILDDFVAKYGIAFLIDCHSMPSDTRGATSQRNTGTPNIVLGDCWGSSCMRDLTDIAETLFLEEGFLVRRNVPYSGGYSTSYYGAPKTGVHALQIEISRSLYMDEETLTPLPEFEAIKRSISVISRKLGASITERAAKYGKITRAAE